MILKRFNPARALGLRTTIVLVVVALIYIDYYPRFSWFILGLATASFIAAKWMSAHESWLMRTPISERASLTQTKLITSRAVLGIGKLAIFGVGILALLAWFSVFTWHLRSLQDPEHWISGISAWIRIPLLAFIFPVIIAGIAAYAFTIFSKSNAYKKIQKFLKEVSEDAAKD